MHFATPTQIQSIAWEGQLVAPETPAAFRGPATAPGLGLKFAGAELKMAEAGATIDYRKVFPVIQAYGAGRALCEWKFKPHPKHPIDGTQFVYAVIAAKPDSNTVRANLELSARVETKFGPVTLGLPKEAQAKLAFTIPE